MWFGSIQKIVLAGILAGACSACTTAKYYGQAIAGQCQIISQGKTIAGLVRRPGLPDELRRKFLLVGELRDFARTDLNLPPGQHYSHYVDLGRPFVVWNVHAAPELSLEPKTWWYPVVGRLKYRGYFSQHAAEFHARKLARHGFDVYVEGVEAYSTLGWFSDPLLNTFIHHEESELAEILFHELAHQIFFARGDTDLNEAFATAVAEEGVRRWLAAHGTPEQQRRYEQKQRWQQEVVDLILQTRRQLEVAYEEENDSDPGARRGSRFPASQRLRGNSAEPRKRLAKEKVSTEFYQSAARLQARSPASVTNSGKAREGPINNARLNAIATYYRLVPAFREMLAGAGGDMAVFYRRVKELENKSSARRDAILSRRTKGEVEKPR